jgi:hypothetical protein
MYASQINGLNVNIIDTLLRKGADVNYCNVKNQTAFSIACTHNNSSVAFFLLENGATANFSQSDIETNARMNFLLGEYYSLFKSDIAKAKPYYEKAIPLFKTTLQERKEDLSKINTKKAGNMLLELVVGDGILGNMLGVESYWEHINPYVKDKDNFLFRDYQISEKASMDEQKVYNKNKIEQFEQSIKFIEDKLACIEKGLTGDEFNTCIGNIKLSK